MKKILVYGSLRNGEYNFERFKQYYPEGMNYILTMIINGYQLHSMGPYPGIRPKEGCPLTVDVLEVSDECFKTITDMERGAGYYEETVTIAGEEHTIYVYGYPLPENTVVETGDWSLFLQEKKKKALTY